jgi:surfeit locus 1 family protein
MERAGRRRLTIVGIAVVVAAVCVALGLWQLRRLSDRRALNDEILLARAAPAVLAGSASDIESLAPYRRVIVRGTYDVDAEVLLYGRSLREQPGHEVVTPLVFDDGSAVLVIRGWVPFSIAARAPVTEASPSARRVLVEGWLVPPETTGESRPDRDGVVRTLDIEGIGDGVTDDLAPLAIQLHEQDPAPASLPEPVPLPQLSEGPHLSYAIQWFSFAAIALVGAFVLLRRKGRSATPSP